ncbi:MAG: hypothetical protein HC919_07385 [Oscillatoriales cyanobacterium SM2_2_1]|nr:hypothetical protein [Oscillatoriales cyanobacterium SM2_2_1]
MTSILGIESESLRLCLDKLAELEIIEQRLVELYSVDKKPPIKLHADLDYQVFPCWESSLELLEKAYDNDVATPNRPLKLALDGYLDDVEVPDFSQFLKIFCDIKPFQMVYFISLLPDRLLIA